MSKPPEPPISPIVPMPSFCMSSYTLPTAMRSECGVLKTHFLTGSTITEAPPSEMNGSSASSTSCSTAMLSPVVVPPMIASTCVLLDQPLGEGHRVLGAHAGVVGHELELMAGDAALLIELLDVELEGLPLGLAEERGRPGHREERADPDRVLGRRRPGERQTERADERRGRAHP